MMTPDNFNQLLNKWRKGEMTPGEVRDFVALANTGEYDELIQEVMEVDFETERFKTGATKEGKENDWQLIEGRMQASVPKIAHRVHFLRTAWFRVAVAMLILITSWFVYDQFLNNSRRGDRQTSSAETLPKTEILPGSNKAVLTLSDGRKVELDNAAAATINDGSLIIRNDDGELKYGQVEGVTHPAAGAGSDYVGDASARRHPSEGGDWQASYNTMTTPRGGQYKLVLPDGSKVWLNAESSITFPTVFTGKTREIKMTGEVYFEIKTDKSKPFIVKTASDEIQVLGTSFNVNAYNDAPAKTSLLEGSVKINTSILKPGQAYSNQKISATDIAQDIAWKNGRFDFTGLDVKQAMNQIGRWYDVNIEYRGNVEIVKFRGSLKRSIPLNDLLTGLEGIGGLHFTAKGKTLIIYR